MFLFFFFQAEDGIRDGTVTGVQTCALPISISYLKIDAAVEREQVERVGRFKASRDAAKVERRLKQVAEACRERSEEHTSELQSQFHLVCRLLLEKKKKKMRIKPVLRKQVIE